jgi:hypothetical protein
VAISSNEISMASTNIDWKLSEDNRSMKRRDLDNGKLKLFRSFIASAHKSFCYLAGSIKMKSKRALEGLCRSSGKQARDLCLRVKELYLLFFFTLTNPLSVTFYFQ